MERSKFLMVVIVFLLILNLGTLTFLFFSRHQGPPRPPHRKEGPARFLIEELEFDDQQQTKFNELKKEHQGQMRMMEDSMRVERELLPDIIVSGNQEKADSVAAKIGNHQQRIEQYTYQHFVKVYALCNETQKKKFKNIIGDMLKMMAPHKGGPPPR